MAERNDTMRDAMLFTAGAAVGILAGRLAAPVAAKTAGMARAITGGADAFDELIADHRRVLSALEKAEVERNSGRQLALFLTIKRDLAKHSMAEEDIIYPLIADKLLSVDAAQHLYKEHGEVKTLLAEIEEAIEAADELRYQARMRSLLTSIRAHAEEEEQRWFPRLKDILDEKKRTLIAGKVDREKAAVG